MADIINTLDNIQNKIKLQLHAKNVDDSITLERWLSQFDTNNSGWLSRDQFEKFFAKLGIFLTTQELRTVYNAYDTDKNGQITYYEFIQYMRTSMSQKRLAAVKHAFQFLDQQGQGSLDLQYLFSQFNVNAHPRVKAKQKTVEQVMNEFQLAMSKKSSNGQSVTESEFLDFYADYNATLPVEKEQYFVDTVLNTWRVQGQKTYVSPQRIAEIETILFEKIRQKTPTLEDEGKTVATAFKYFDIFDTGVIDLSQFARVLDKFGCLYSDKEVQALFNKFDVDKSGKICFDEFCGFFAQMGGGENSKFVTKRTIPTNLINKIQKDLQMQGLYSIRRMGECFKKSDKNQNGTLDRDEFKWALKECSFVFTKVDTENLFKYFDKNMDNSISYNEFIDVIRGEKYNGARYDVVQRAFQKFDVDGSGIVDYKDIIAGFDPNCHKLVVQGKRNNQEIYKEFLKMFDNVQKDGVISNEEFHNYYKDISANIINDATFCSYIEKAWNL